MKWYRENKCITEMTDTEINAAIQKLREAAKNIDSKAVEYRLGRCQESYKWMRGRKAVKEFVCLFDTVEALLTVTHCYEATAETKAWSDWEGGHVYSEHPNMKSILGW